jgi:hypothetical protein
MEYRQLGRSGLRVSALTLGTMTFGGQGVFKPVGTTDVTQARVADARGYERFAAQQVYWHQLNTASDRLGPADHARLGLHLRDW